jgi:hypothetical protein
VGVAGTDFVPVEVPASSIYAAHPYDDSTDSPAALFLVDLNAWYQTTVLVSAGSSVALEGLSSLPTDPNAKKVDVVDEAMIAIHSTIDATSGLTDGSLGYTGWRWVSQSALAPQCPGLGAGSPVGGQRAR